jgi:hypothetical protein
MSTNPSKAKCQSNAATSELLLLPDGRLLVHNLTSDFARLLAELNPGDSQIAPRSLSAKEYETLNLPHELPN